jgi:hypothetical protein
MADEVTSGSRIWAELRPFFGWIGGAIVAVLSGFGGMLISKRRDDKRAAAETKKDEAEAATIETNRDITVGGAWKQFALDQVELLESRVQAQAKEIADLQTQLAAAQELGGRLNETLTQLTVALAANLVLTERNHRLEQEIASLRKALGDVPAAT